LIYTIAGALPMASSIILLPFYIGKLTTEMLGALWIYLAYSMLIQIVVTFSFDTSIYIHYHELKNQRQKLNEFISSSFIFMILLATVICLLCLPLGDSIFRLVFSHTDIQFYPFGFVSTITACFQSLFKVYCSLLQSQQKPESFFRANLLSFSLIASLTIIGLHLYPNSLLGPLGGRLIAGCLSGFFALINVVRIYGFQFNPRLLQSSFSFNFFSFLYQLQQWLMTNFDRILISFFLPLTEVGIYGFLISCLSVLDFLINGLFNSFSPKVISMLVDQKVKHSTPEINRYFHALTAISMLMVTGVIFILPLLVQHFIHRADYQKIIPFIPLAILIYLYKGLRLFFGIPYGMLKFNKPLPFIYLVVAAAKISLVISTTSHFGIYGVVASTLMSYGLEIILLYQFGKEKFIFNFNKFKMIVAPLLLTALILVSEAIFSMEFMYLLHATYIVACIVILYWAFRKEQHLFSFNNFIK
jgi:O-antigen/teichoic acid export membrane protein